MTDQSDSVNEGIGWFKAQFAEAIRKRLATTSYPLNFVTAIAVKESFGDAWGLTFRSAASTPDVLALCVGDQIDGNRATEIGRQAFPVDRAELEAYGPDGVKMFAVAHRALTNIADATGLPAPEDDKFARGYGIFQYDLQHFREGDAEFFLKEQWSDFDACLTRLLRELDDAKQSLYRDKQALSEDELCYVAVGYNAGAGNVDLSKDFRSQGFGGDYGTDIECYMKLAAAIPDARGALT